VTSTTVETPPQWASGDAVPRRGRLLPSGQDLRGVDPTSPTREKRPAEPGRTAGFECHRLAELPAGGGHVSGLNWRCHGNTTSGRV